MFVIVKHYILPLAIVNYGNYGNKKVNKYNECKVRLTRRAKNF